MLWLSTNGKVHIVSFVRDKSGRSTKCGKIISNPETSTSSVSVSRKDICKSCTK